MSESTEEVAEEVAEEISLKSVDAKATRALRVSLSNEAKLDALEAKSEKRHDETMAAIKASSGVLNNAAIVKLLAAGALLLTSLAGIGNALTPVLPDVLRAKYPAPVVVVTSPAPTTSAPQVAP